MRTGPRRRTAHGTAAAGRSRREPRQRRSPPRRVRGRAAWRAARSAQSPNTSRTVSLNWRTLANPAENATSAIGQVGADQQHPRRVRAMRPGQRERSCAELRGEQPGQVPGGVAQPRGEPWHALALHHAVRDQPHRAGGDVAAQIPLRRSRRGLGQAALAGAVAGLVRGGAGREERDVLRLRRAGGAARPAVDAGRAHRRHELPVEARVPRVDRAIPLVETHGGVGRPGKLMAPLCTSDSRRLAEIGHGSAGSGRCATDGAQGVDPGPETAVPQDSVEEVALPGEVHRHAGAFAPRRRPRRLGWSRPAARWP